jgi:cytochrome P450
MAQGAPTATIPDHVPPELVKPFDFRNGLGDRPHEVIAALHEGPRTFYSPVHQQGEFGIGHWVFTRAEDIRAVFQDPATFSSENITGRAGGVGAPLVPLEFDPPTHSAYRALMNPIFSPARMKVMESKIRERAAGFIEPLAARGECDFVADFARQFPAAIFVDLMGLPAEEIPQFLAWEARMVGSGGVEDKRAATGEVVQYLKDLCTARRRQPADDLVTFAVTAEMEGRKLSDDEVNGMTFLLFIAGLDTVASALGWHMRYLAEHPADQRRLREEPGLIPDAMEELMRAFSTVSSSRWATRDVEIGGVLVRAGDLVTVSTPLANLDPEEFDDPTRVDFGRTPNRHTAFAYGPHRCLGSHLARREMIIAHEEWARRIPPYRMKPGAPLTTHGGGVLGLDTLPLTWR